MILYIIRHAIAAPAGGEAGEQDDSQRALTDKGRKKMRRIAQALKELKAPIDLILTSPYLRATQTARILRKTLGLGKDKVVLAEDLMPAGEAEHLVNEIKDHFAAAGNIALVGHEPSLSRLISVLVSGDPTLPILLEKGGICRLSIEKLQYGRCAILEWLLAPAQLTRIGR